MMFTAMVVLQLVGEGRVELDAPIERYLPRLVRGKGIDGRKITIRQLLQHNYTLAGLLVQKVTGRPIGEEITRRIIDRIGLRRTYWPSTGNQNIRERHPHGYYAAKPGSPLVDVTVMDPSLGGGRTADLHAQ